MIDPLVVERDLALDDEMALDRALRIVKLFYLHHGSDPVTAKYAEELAAKLIKVKRNARARHQTAEHERLRRKHEEEMISQLM